MKEAIKIPEGVKELKISQESGRVVIEFVPEFKKGDFVTAESTDTCIYHSTKGTGGIISFAGTGKYSTTFKIAPGWGYTKHFRLATEEEKQKLLDALKRGGKRWNAEKLCIEDIPQRKFKPGNKVKLKDGMLDKCGENPYFTTVVGVFIGKVLTVKSYTSKGSILLNEAGSWVFAEAWLELYSDEPEVGELAIFWDSCKEHSRIRIYTQRTTKKHRDHLGMLWANAIKFISKEQFEKHIKE